MALPIIPLIMGGSALLGGVGKMIHANKQRKAEQAALDADHAERQRRGQIFQSLLKAYGLDAKFPAGAFDMGPKPKTYSQGPNWFDIFSGALSSGAGAYLGGQMPGGGGGFNNMGLGNFMGGYKS